MRDPFSGNQRGLKWISFTAAAGIFVIALVFTPFMHDLNLLRSGGAFPRCRDNMRQIGVALALYANDNHGQYPPRLEDLLLTGDISPYVLVCPSSNDSPAPGATTQAQVAALSSGGHESYIYVPNLNSSVSPDTVLLYEPLSNHGGAGMNVLYGDGHVEFDQSKQAAGIIAELKAGYNPPRAGHY